MKVEIKLNIDGNDVCIKELEAQSTREKRDAERYRKTILLDLRELCEEAADFVRTMEITE